MKVSIPDMTQEENSNAQFSIGWLMMSVQGASGRISFRETQSECWYQNEVICIGDSCLIDDWSEISIVTTQWFVLPRGQWYVARQERG